MGNIYDEVERARSDLSLLSSEHALLILMRFENGKVCYTPEFLKRYCDNGLVNDEFLRNYISDLWRALS